ncbi:MAG TPA: SGNH/GDSL hydrolase family protein [Gemmatimonadaceae bacterium]|nr:SGNH/GDSL hydrolase family protein [Gemmatimonadaceae bacterium]
MLRHARIVAAVIAALPLMVVVAEVTTRFDDWLRFDMPFTANADEAEDLQTFDTLGVRGRPYGRYLHYHLDNHGFRGAQDFDVMKTAGCTRVMALGASETFGATEPEGFEYPAQLARRLGQRGCAQVLNAGVPGMTLPQIRYTWNHYWRQFAPDYVLIYPTPVFYLANNRPRGPRIDALRNGPLTRTPFRPRLLFLAHQAFSYPEIIQRRRVERFTQAALAGTPDDSLWRRVPEERLTMFAADLDSLVTDVQVAGSTPVLMTHAIRFAMHPDPADADVLAAWRQFTPRALSPVMIAFEARAAEETRGLAARRGLPLADVACVLTGQREHFSDFVHFTADGAAIVAEVTEHALFPDGSAGLSRPANDRVDCGDDRQVLETSGGRQVGSF